MAGGRTGARLNLVPDRLLEGLEFSARMIGDSDRSSGRDSPEFEFHGELGLNPLTETLIRSGRVYTADERNSGFYHRRARGATPLVGACLTFEHLRRERGGEHLPQGFDVAVNAAISEGTLKQISSYPGIDRTFDAMDKLVLAAQKDASGLPIRHTVTFERHGQHDELQGASTKNYVEQHRLYRQRINERVREIMGSEAPAPWIATQISGAYGSSRRHVAQAQLNMALSDPDYFLATPDYPFPHFGKTKPPHPFAADRHPTALATLMASDYLAWARFYVQVLGRNWFPTHVGEAIYKGSFILVCFRAMAPPLRISEVCVSTEMAMLHALGFDVEDARRDIPIVGVPEQVGELTFIVECNRKLHEPAIGLARGSFGLADIGAKGCGATNIRDSQELPTVFRPRFVDGYTDMFAGGEIDPYALEDCDALFAMHDMGNWAAAQKKKCVTSLPPTGKKKKKKKATAVAAAG
jgi:hypothetical protein